VDVAGVEEDAAAVDVVVVAVVVGAMTGKRETTGERALLGATTSKCSPTHCWRRHADATCSVQAPVIQSTVANGDAAKSAGSNGKRLREDDGASAPPAKKVDVKPQATAAQ